MRPLFLITAILVALGTAAGGVWAMQQDLAPLYLGPSNFERIEAVRMPGDLSGLSIANQQQALRDCTNVLANVRMTGASEELTDRQRLLVERCLDIADHTTGISPTSSQAWYVGAAAAAMLEDWDGMNRRLLLSQKTGRSEQWIASFRVTLAEANRDRLDADTRAANDQDLALMVGSWSGVGLIAYRYVSQADFRARIIDIVEQLPATEQQRFIARIRQLANARN